MLRIFCDDDCLKKEGFWSLRKTKHPFPDSSLAARARRALLNEGFPGKPYVAQPSSSPLALASAAQYLAVAQISAASCTWLLQATVFHQADQLEALSLKGLGAAVFVSIVACVLCYAVLYWLLKQMDGHRLALFDAFHALSATLFGYLIFHESLTPVMLIGGALILLGLILGNWPKKILDEIPE
jgi:drug/metabolite transporter (DMT)-like permease